MTFAAKGSPPGHGGDPLELSSSDSVDLQANIPNQAFSQENNRASITCASIRANELRGGLVRELSRTMAIGLQAQAALYDCDDDVALACLRLHWRVTFAGIGPRAVELLNLKKAGTPL